MVSTFCPAAVRGAGPLRSREMLYLVQSGRLELAGDQVEDQGMVLNVSLLARISDLILGGSLLEGGTSTRFSPLFERSPTGDSCSRRPASSLFKRITSGF